MKKIISVIVTLLVLLMASASIAFAEGTTVDTSSSVSTTADSTAVTTATNTPAATETTTATTPATTNTQDNTQQASSNQSVTENVYNDAGITPDSVLYPIEKMLESVQVAFTFSDAGKAELLVSFAKERLAEAEIMTDKNKLKLVNNVMDAYVNAVKEANEKLENAAKDDKDVSTVLGDIKLVEAEGGKILIKASAAITEETADQIKAAISDEVKKTLVSETFAVAKGSFNVARDSVKDAKGELKMAQETGSQELIKAAEDKLKAAALEKEKAELVKNEVEQYKEEVKKALDGQDKDDEDKECNNKEDIQKKIDKMQELIKKQEEKRAEMVKKLEAHSTKAAAKIEENTKKQLLKRQGKVEELKKLLGTTEVQGQQTTAASVTTQQVSTIDSDDEDEKDNGEKIAEKDSGRDNTKKEAWGNKHGKGHNKK